MAAILNPPFLIFQFLLQNRNQRPQKPKGHWLFLCFMQMKNVPLKGLTRYGYQSPKDLHPMKIVKQCEFYVELRETR